MEILEYLNNIISFLIDHIKLSILFIIVGIGVSFLPVEQSFLNISSYSIWSLLLATVNIIAVSVPVRYIANLFGIDLDLGNGKFVGDAW